MCIYIVFGALRMWRLKLTSSIMHTQFGEDNEVLRVALGTGHACCTVAPLFLVYPALQTGLVHPLGGAAASARPYPLSGAVILICGKTHPATPAQQRGWDVNKKYTWLHFLFICQNAPEEGLICLLIVAILKTCLHTISGLYFLLNNKPFSSL